MTELESLALLIADLNAQLRAAQARIRELEAALERPPAHGHPEGQHSEQRHEKRHPCSTP